MNQDIATKASEDEFDQTLADMFAQSEAAFRKYVAVLSDIERQMIGAPKNVPEKMADWVFYRCGQRGVPVWDSLAQMLRQQGWVDAPRGVQFVGFELFDGPDRVQALCAPQPVYRRMKAIEDAVAAKLSVKASIERFGDLVGTIDGMKGVEIDDVTVSVDERSFGDAVSEGNRMAEVARRRPRYKQS